MSPGAESTPVSFYTATAAAAAADTPVSPPLSSPLPPPLPVTHLLYSISALDQSTPSAPPPLSTPHRATCSILAMLSLTCLLPKAVTCRLGSYSKPFPSLVASFLSSLSVCLSCSHHFHPQLPLTFHSYPLVVLSLPLIHPLPLPNHYQFSLTHYLLLAPSLPPPLPLIPPLSIPVSVYPPYISSALALPSPHLQQHEYIIIYTMEPCLLFMNYQPCGQTKPIFIRNLHFISAPIRLGAKE